MRRHPSNRIERLIAEAQDRQAMDLANRGQADLEVWAGGRMRLDDDLANGRQVIERSLEIQRAYGWSDEPRQSRTGLSNLVVPVLMVVGLYLLVVAATVAGEMIGGWPA